jgi:hypothetical protein
MKVRHLDMDLHEMPLDFSFPERPPSAFENFTHQRHGNLSRLPGDGHLRGPTNRSAVDWIDGRTVNRIDRAKGREYGASGGRHQRARVLSILEDRSGVTRRWYFSAGTSTVGSRLRDKR